ncbi:MAG: Trp family transcriptional regulator [Patescibacteria group bacterium]|jgi:Trp operon repressor
MIRLSKIAVQPDKLEKIFNLFFLVFGRKQNKEEFMNTLLELMSYSERLVFAKRIAIMFLLEKDIDYAVIKKNLHVSLSTIAKFAILYERSHIIKAVMQQAQRSEEIKLFLEELVFEFLDKPLTQPTQSNLACEALHRKREATHTEGF